MSCSPDPFDFAVTLILALEGGHSNDPLDPGGDTWFGIARAAHPTLPWPPTREQAIAVYQSEYWVPCGGEHLPPAFALATFDAAVNQGLRPAVTMLQASLGVTADGIVGPDTVTAAQCAEPAVLDRFFVLRAHRYIRHPLFERYGTGWLARLFHVARVAAGLGQGALLT